MVKSNYNFVIWRIASCQLSLLMLQCSPACSWLGQDVVGRPIVPGTPSFVGWWVVVGSWYEILSWLSSVVLFVHASGQRTLLYLIYGIPTCALTTGPRPNGDKSTVINIICIIIIAQPETSNVKHNTSSTLLNHHHHESSSPPPSPTSLPSSSPS